MVNFTYVGLLVGLQGLLWKFNFAVMYFYSLEKWQSLPLIEKNLANRSLKFLLSLMM